jgi:hypothetical protein
MSTKGREEGVMLLGGMDAFRSTDAVYAFADDLGSEGGFQGTTTGEHAANRRALV